MKIRIKTFNGQLPDYLTMGKVYEVTQCEVSKEISNCGWIFADNGVKSFIDFDISNHLNGGSWEIVE